MRRASFIMAVLGSLTGACTRNHADRPYPLQLNVESDPGRPLAGAHVLYQDNVVGTSKDDGSVKLAVRGVEGTVTTFIVKCPEGYRSTKPSIEFLLRRFDDDKALPEYRVACRPAKRSVVIAVRAENGADLPLRYLGHEIARTDSSGAAHALLSASPEEDIELLLDTTGPGKERLRPQNPTTKFTVKDRDDLVLFDAPLTELEEKRAAAAPVKRVSLPTRLDRLY